LLTIFETLFRAINRSVFRKGAMADFAEPVGLIVANDLFRR
ncbi:unnamed protein product, partial [marine sediment metagenome]